MDMENVIEKKMQVKERERKKSIVLEGASEADRGKYMNEVNKIVGGKEGNPRSSRYNVSCTRKIGDYNKNELEINLSKNTKGWKYVENTYYTESTIQKRMDSKRGEREVALKERYEGIVNTDQAVKNGVVEWKEQLVRVGTGFRVRKDEKDPSRRRFDVGYADVKRYKRKENREVVVDSSSMGRTVIGKGENARVKVMNAVSDIEKRRPVSKYTGSGILRKSMQGKRKLKSTKSSSK